MLQHCEVIGVRVVEGRVTGVETTRGFIGANRVALACAGNSSRVAGMVGLTLPIETHVLQAFVSEGVKPLIDTVVTYGAGHFYISQSDKGGMVFGGDIDGYNSYAQRGSLPLVEDVMELAVQVFPPLSRLRYLRQWGGVMDMSMDGSPIIDRTPHWRAVPELRLVLWRFQGDAGVRLVFRPYDRPRRSPSVERRAMRLDRFATGHLIDERSSGPTPNLH